MPKPITSPPPAGDGFVLLGKRSRPLGTKLDALVQVLEKLGEYEAIQTNDSIWIRATNAKNSRRPCEVLATITASQPNVLRTTAAVAAYESNTYGVHFYKRNDPWSLETIKKQLTGEGFARSTPQSWNGLSKAVFHCPRGSLSTLLLDHIFPLIFQWHPNATISLLAHNPAFEQAFAILRNMRIGATFDVQSLHPDTPEGLMAWQLDSVPQFISMLVEWSTVLQFPTVSGMLLDAFGFSIHVSDDHIGTYDPPGIPVSWLDSKHEKCQFAKESADLVLVGQRATFNLTAYHGRYCWNGPTQQSSVLAEFIIDRATRLISAISDLTNYVREVDGEVQVDLVVGQEHKWTLARILRRTLSLQSSESRWINRIAVFEIADQWAELMLEWKSGGPKRSAGYFRMLMHPVLGRNLVETCLGAMSEPWLTRFRTTCNNVYDEIRQTAKNSVWANKRKSAAGLDLSTSGPAVTPIESWDDFTSNVLRDLRNTHHGYMPDEHSKNTRLRLILTTGEWSPALTYLPSLWLLAFLCDPKTFLGWPEKW